MALQRMDHVTVVVRDLDAAVDFFRELGMEVDGTTQVQGEWVDRICGIDGVTADITMLHTPDGHGRIELTRYVRPEPDLGDRAPEPVETPGLRQVMFAVDDLDGTVARLQGRGAGLVGEIVRYEDVYRLCYLRGPEGIIVALAEELR
ncbi:VOC family protein [Corynebacterium kalidii]|uniref:VOC family protein n=1 Tax=Corynebacterium kalidii TaxID=2931982 RepID=A0A9X2AYV8_9CORY|nr:VOC family protein [Corynebacterium kalidii]MCJ7858148.1 VOC family protein [Corynebacterium kalidii]